MLALAQDNQPHRFSRLYTPQVYQALLELDLDGKSVAGKFETIKKVDIDVWLPQPSMPDGCAAWQWLKASSSPAIKRWVAVREEWLQVIECAQVPCT